MDTKKETEPVVRGLARPGPGAWTPAGSPMWVAGSQVLGPCSTAFAGAPAGSWVRDEGVATGASTYTLSQPDAGLLAAASRVSGTLNSSPLPMRLKGPNSAVAATEVPF